MEDLNYPDHFYADATRPHGIADANRRYDETPAIASAQDAKLDHLSDALPSILAEFRAVTKRLEDYAERMRVSRTDSAKEHAPKWSPQWLAEQGIPADSAYLASFSPNGSRIATAAEIDGLRDLLTAEELKGFGIGDVHPLRHAVLDERSPEDRL